MIMLYDCLNNPFPVIEYINATVFIFWVCISVQSCVPCGDVFVHTSYSIITCFNNHENRCER